MCSPDSHPLRCTSAKSGYSKRSATRERCGPSRASPPRSRRSSWRRAHPGCARAGSARTRRRTWSSGQRSTSPDSTAASSTVRFLQLRLDCLAPLTLLLGFSRHRQRAAALCLLRRRLHLPDRHRLLAPLDQARAIHPRRAPRIRRAHRLVASSRLLHGRHPRCRTWQRGAARDGPRGSVGPRHGQGDLRRRVPQRRTATRAQPEGAVRRERRKAAAARRTLPHHVVCVPLSFFHALLFLAPTLN